MGRGRGREKGHRKAVSGGGEETGWGGTGLSHKGWQRQSRNVAPCRGAGAGDTEDLAPLLPPCPTGRSWAKPRQQPSPPSHPPSSVCPALAPHTGLPCSSLCPPLHWQQVLAAGPGGRCCTCLNECSTQWGLAGDQLALLVVAWC